MARAKCTLSSHEHDSDMKDYHGVCLGLCFRCEEHLKQDGRYTTYCPSCDACSSCEEVLGWHTSECRENPDNVESTD